MVTLGAVGVTVPGGTSLMLTLAVVSAPSVYALAGSEREDDDLAVVRDAV